VLFLEMTSSLFALDRSLGPSRTYQTFALSLSTNTEFLALIKVDRHHEGKRTNINVLDLKRCSCFQVAGRGQLCLREVLREEREVRARRNCPV
jgi:hypothetical protein